MIRCVLSYIHYPMALARYMDFALRRREDVELFTVGPYTGTWIPWSGGINLPIKYAIPPDLPLSSTGQLPVVPAVWVERQLPWKPDLWLNVDAGWHLFGRPNHGVNVFVGTDPHVLDYSQQRTLADVFFCMQTPYMREGDKYLPYAYDPNIHYYDKATPLEYDACLVGLAYEERTALVNALRQRNLDVYYGIGPVFDEYRDIYNRSTFALCWSSKQDLCARVFEGMAMGNVVVSNRVPDLQTLFTEGKHYIGFDSIGEAVEKIMYYQTLDTLDEAFKIAKAGIEAVKPHTWDERIEQIFEAVQ